MVVFEYLSLYKPVVLTNKIVKPVVLTKKIVIVSKNNILIKRKSSRTPFIFGNKRNKYKDKYLKMISFYPIVHNYNL